MRISKETIENAVGMAKGLFGGFAGKSAQQYSDSDIGKKRKAEIKAGKKPKIFICFGTGRR